MIFELTDSLAKEILFYMENQEGEFVFDVSSKTVLPISAVDESADEENICSLPSWSSKDGFILLERFTDGVRSKKIQTELKAVLANGRGVFRNFKIVLKNYPEIERRFYKFKEKEMHLRLMEWYNALRESWGLEKLEEDSEESENLLYEDFTFHAYNPERDKDCVALGASAIADEILEDNPDELGASLARIWLGRFDFFRSEGVNGFVCRTLSDDFAGCLLFSECVSPTKKAVALAACFVAQNYRGLGIAKELFSVCFSELHTRGVQWFIIADSAIPQGMESLLINQFGFKKTGTCFVATLF
ncbi:MAG: hypothetical protein II921_05995 [Treponema sp.]|nr:hypothetical protein [Treponema sp.]